jgi:endonuclease YncB( thermonuclease family)
MQSKIRRKTPSGRPSRIRRDPVRLEVVKPLTKAEIEKAEAKAREREIWGGVAGVALFGLGIAALAIVVATATLVYVSPSASKPSARFEQCYAASGPNCVADGATIRVHGEQVTIAGIAVPQIADAKCPEERTRGIDAAVRLAGLLNAGQITIGRAYHDDWGREVRKVKVDGDDVGNAMIDAGVAREYDGSKPDWCAPADADSDSN